MITIGFSTREDNPKYVDYLQKTSMYKDVQIIQKINNGEKSLSQVYNEIINESTNDIVVLVHDDLEFETKNWGEKVLKHFLNHERCYTPIQNCHTNYWTELLKSLLST